MKGSDQSRQQPQSGRPHFFRYSSGSSLPRKEMYESVYDEVHLAEHEAKHGAVSILEALDELPHETVTLLS